MFKSYGLKCVLGSILLAAPLFTAHATDITRGEMLSISCAGCHGPHGNSPGAIPSLKGKSKSFMVTALKEFRAGKRDATVMDRHAKAYTDAEIELIAEYFAGLE